MVFLPGLKDLFFRLADELEDQLPAPSSAAVRVVILGLKRAHSLIATVLGVLERFIRSMRERQGPCPLRRQARARDRPPRLRLSRANWPGERV